MLAKITIILLSSSLILKTIRVMTTYATTSCNLYIYITERIRIRANQFTIFMFSVIMFTTSSRTSRNTHTFSIRNTSSISTYKRFSTLKMKWRTTMTKSNTNTLSECPTRFSLTPNTIGAFSR